MRSLLRAGVIALAASSIVLGGSVAAQAAPAGEITVNVNRLIFEPGTYGHTGSIRITVRNTSSEPFEGSISITEPITATIDQVVGGSGCTLGPDDNNLGVTVCPLDQPIAPGGRAVLTATFESPAKPQAYAQIAPFSGQVKIADAEASFPAIFRSTTGSLRNPRAYVQDTAAALTVTAPDVTLTQQEDGTFAGRVPVTVVNGGDAPHYFLGAELITPAGIDEWPGIEPSEACGQLSDESVPPGGFGIGCGLTEGGLLAEGETRTFEWLLTAPAGTSAGPLGTASTLVKLGYPGPEQNNNANTATFAITVAG